MARRMRGAVVVLVQIYLAAIKVSQDLSEQFKFAKEKLADVYKSEAAAGKIDDDFVKQRMTQARTAIRNNFMVIDNKKVRVFPGKDGDTNIYTDKAHKNVVPETAQKIDPPTLWERSSRESILDSLDGLLADVELPVEM